MYVFGGRNPLGYELNDFWKLDLGTKTWSQVHGDQKALDPLERDSPITALRSGHKRKNKHDQTMKGIKLESSFKKEASLEATIKKRFSFGFSNY